MTSGPRRFSIPALTAAALLLSALFAIAALWKTEADPDLFGYLAFGRLFYSGPGFPYHDVFSYLPVRPLWVYHEWLTGVIFYKLLTLSGWAGLQVLRWALGISALFFCAAAAKRLEAGLFSIGLTLCLCINIWAAGYNPVRAQAFTYLFFAACLYIIARARENPRLPWLFVPLMLLWQNLHGGFPVGFALFFLCAAAAKGARLRFLLPALASLALVWVNPYGFSYYPYMIEALSFPRAEIGEWLPLWRALAVGYPPWAAGLYLLLGIFAALAMRRSLRERPEDAALLAATFLAGLLVVRHQVFFALAAAALLPSRWGEPGKAIGKPALAILALALALNFFAFGLQARLAFRLGNPMTVATPEGPGAALTSVDYPVEAAGRLMRMDFAGNLLTEFEWGEYVIWALSPGVRVAFDGRYDTVFPESVCREYLDFIRGRPGWEEFLARYPHDAVLARKDGSLYRLMLRAPGWAPAWERGSGVFFLRAPEPAAP